MATRPFAYEELGFRVGSSDSEREQARTRMRALRAARAARCAPVKKKMSPEERRARHWEMKKKRRQQVALEVKAARLAETARNASFLNRRLSEPGRDV